MTRTYLTFLVFAAVLAPAVYGQVSGPPGEIYSIVAGGGPPDGAVATNVALANVAGVVVDTGGNLYFSSGAQNRVFRIATNGTLTTVAGTGTSGYSGDFGPAVNAQLNTPGGIALDSAGNLYIADTGNARVRKVSGRVITTVAGNGSFGYSGDGVPATGAQLNNPQSVAVDSAGNLYIADCNNSRIRKVSGGVITTVAGNGGYGYSGDGGLATSAQIGTPYGVAVDSAGNLYIADTFNYRIRKVSGGAIATVAGNGAYGYSGDGGPAAGSQISLVLSVAVDSAGNVYIPDSGNYRIRKVSGGTIATVAGNGVYGYSGDGGPATRTQISNPYCVGVDSAGNIYVADSSNFRIRKVSGGVMTTVGGNGTYRYSGDGGAATSAQINPDGVVADTAGNVYIADLPDHRVRKVSAGVITTAVGNGTAGFFGDGGPAASAQISDASGLAIDGGGSLYILDGNNYRVRKVSAGSINTVAGNGTSGYSGDGGPAMSAQLGPSQGIAVDSQGVIYISDQLHNRIRKISGGLITNYAGGGPPDGVPATNVSIAAGAVAVDSTGNIYVTGGGLNRVYKVSPAGTITAVAGDGTYGFSGDTGLATSAQLNSPQGVAVDSAGNLYITDTGNGRVRKVSAGVITTVAGGGSGCAQQTDGLGDGCPATSAPLNSPQGVAVDSAGNLYIGDNSRIRKVSGGVITLVAGNGVYGYAGDGGPATSALISYPSGMAVDIAGNLYIADSNNYRIRQVSGGVITTFAGNGTYGYAGDGGPATSAQIANDYGVAVDSAGNVYIADYDNGRIRKVSGGVITTVVGGGGGCIQQTDLVGDGCPAASAVLSYPHGVAVGSTGTIYIADSVNYRIRKVSGGVISTVAGNGSSSYSGDGGPAANAQLDSPSGLAVDGAGNLYVGDTGNGRVRVISNAGTITTFAGGGTQGIDGVLANNATLSLPRAIAVDSGGTVYIGDAGNHLLRKVSAGVIKTVSTFAATVTTFFGGGNFPFAGGGGIAVDNLNRVYVSDTTDGRVRQIGAASVLAITKTHVGNFFQGQNGASYTVTVSNAGTGSTSGPVTMTETVPSGLTLVAMTGTGWLCPSGGNTCTRSDSLAAGASYPPITVIVNVSFTASNPQVNAVSASGGGSVQANTTDSTTITTPTLIGIRSDFNGDGTLDVIWQDPVTGLAQIWFLGGAQGISVIGAVNLTASNPWRIVGIGDFNQDGHPDVVWQDPVSGAAQVWFLGGAQGNVVTGAAVLSTGNSWRIMSVADFNLDGRPDVIWQDQVSGLAQIWFLAGAQGTTVTGAVNLTTSNTWRIVGTGDFNGDSRPDVVWQDQATGNTQIWYLGGAQGNQVIDAVNIGPAGGRLRIASVGDFNADGHPDLIWQNIDTGDSVVWFLGGSNGATFLSASNFSGANSWRIAGPR